MGLTAGLYLQSPGTQWTCPTPNRQFRLTRTFNDKAIRVVDREPLAVILVGHNVLIVAAGHGHFEYPGQDSQIPVYDQLSTLRHATLTAALTALGRQQADRVSRWGTGGQERALSASRSPR